MASLPYPRSHQTIFPQNSRNTRKRLAEKKNLCTSVKSVGGSSPPEASVYSVKSVGEYPPPEISVNSVNSVGGPCASKASVRICEICGRTCANKLGVGSVEGIRKAAWVWQPQNYLPTEFAEHTETTGGEEKSVYICEIRGRLFSARSFCVFCEFCGRTCASKLCGRNLEGGVGMAGMPYPPTSVKICAICGRFLFKGAYLLCWCSRDCCTP